MSRRRNQSGFTLLVVLVVLGFFSLILVALLGLVSNDARTTARFSDLARDRRAADGALQVGMTRLKTAPAATLGQSGSCAGVNGSDVAVNGKVVRVRCAEIPAAVPEPQIASVGGGGTVLTLLGNYSGALDDAAENNLGGVLGAVLASGAQQLNSYLATGPGLIHLGPEPMRVVGDVKVRQSALGWKLPAPSPAIDITGSYMQGDLGALGGIEVKFLDLFTLFTTPRCGLLDETFPGELADQGLRLRASGTRVCAPAGGQNAVVSAAGPTVAAPATWTAAQVSAGTALDPCVPGGVVTIRPGAYNMVQTEALNQRFQRGPAGCHNVTYWFPPGNYYFDVGGFFGGDRSALIFDDPTANWVFGTPNGWNPATGRAPASAFPMACDRKAAGVTITLSNRTVFKHRDGRVAICGAVDAAGTAKPAIYQEASAASLDWAAEPTLAAHMPDATGAAKYNSVASVSASVAPAPATYPAYGAPFDTSEGATRRLASQGCIGACALGVRLTGFVTPGAPAPSGDLGRAVLKIRGTAVDVATPSIFANTSTTVKIVYGDGSGGCTVTAPDIARSVTTEFTVDLLTTCRQFPNNLTDASQLENATIDVIENVNPSEASCLLFRFRCPTASIDYVWLETTTSSLRPPSMMSTVVDPDGGKSFNVFGPVHVPKTQVEVSWAGSVNKTPVFVGSLTARALASVAVDGTRRVGVTVSRDVAPPRRRVRLTAEIDGRVAATTEVDVNDADTSGLVQSPGRLMEIVDWRDCQGSGARAC